MIEYPNEVVTKALLRFAQVPGLDQPAAIITLDNGFDHKKPNSFGPGGLRSLDAAITAATEAQPAFIASATTLCTSAESASGLRMASSLRDASSDGIIALTPSPGTPGEGWGEGDFERRAHQALEITLILTFSRRTGRRDKS